MSQGPKAMVQIVTTIAADPESVVRPKQMVPICLDKSPHDFNKSVGFVPRNP